MTARFGQLGECLSCERVRPIKCRELCMSCWDRHWRNGTLDDYGYVKAHRFAEFAKLRRRGVDVPEAARRTGVSERTGWRYEAELRQQEAHRAA